MVVDAVDGDALPEVVDAVEVCAEEVVLEELALAGAMPLAVVAVEVEAVDVVEVWVMLGTEVVEELALLVTVTLLVLNE